MTEQTRRNLFRYGIAVDLVILATGAGMLAAAPSPSLLIPLYAVAVSLSVWRGGWKGGAVALLLSIVTIVAAFPGALNGMHMATLAVASFAGGSLVAWLTRPRELSQAPATNAEPVQQVSGPVAVPATPEVLAPVVPFAEPQSATAKSAKARAREAKAEKKRIDAERRAAEEQAARERVEKERLAAEAEAEKKRAEEAERRAVEDELARERVEKERLAAEADAEKKRIEEAERKAAEEQAARDRVAAQREAQERLDAERRTTEEESRRQLELERESLQATLERELAGERERVASERAQLEQETSTRPAKIASKPVAQEKPSLFATLTGWLRGGGRSRTVNLKTKRVPANAPAKRAQNEPARPAPPQEAAKPSGKPKLLFIERRRGTADTVTPKLRNRGLEIMVVERWVDAVDEIFRFKPHALFLDIEHPEFERMHRTISDKTSRLPIVLTGRAGSTPPIIPHAAFIGRPYDTEELIRLAQKASTRPEDLLAEQAIPRVAPVMPPPAPAPAPVPSPAPKPVPLSSLPVVDFAMTEPPIAQEDEYEVTCYSCRSAFDAVDADWCSCLASERTLVCTNCLTCFCKAPPAYKENFWMHAPRPWVERKRAELRGTQASLPPNPPRTDVLRPLVLAVEKDQEILAIIQRVCGNLDYGFIWADNGQDGLALAREYRPNLILSNAFLPKLGGREMSRTLKEEPAFAETRRVVMTGLYTDTKYRDEAMGRHHVDDYVPTPVAITDLINLLQKHLEGVTGLPVPEDLHELHRKDIDETRSTDISLSELLAATPSVVPIARSRGDAYDVSCFHCQGIFDATRAEWCTCAGGDTAVACPHCNRCLCEEPRADRERFWSDAPASLFERQLILAMRSNTTPNSSGGTRPLVLLVDDDENVQLLVRTVVTNMGFGLVVAQDGQAGLALAREQAPDMILADAFLPNLDGREFVRRLKEDPRAARAKAVIMTGLYADRKHRGEALAYFEADDYLAKPLAVGDLLELIRKHFAEQLRAAN